MSLYILIITAIGLSIDSFAVSVVYGTFSNERKQSLAIKLAAVFGIFHVLMPLLGYLAGTGVKKYIETIDHWIAFIILLIIGIKMILEGIKDGTENEKTDYNTGIKVISYLAFATSIDALAVGISFSLIDIPIFQTVCIIGLSAFLFTFFGVWFGKLISSKIEFKIQIIGGLILIGIGVKILVEHLHMHYFS